MRYTHCLNEIAIHTADVCTADVCTADVCTADVCTADVCTADVCTGSSVYMLLRQCIYLVNILNQCNM